MFGSELGTKAGNEMARVAISREADRCATMRGELIISIN